MVCCAIWYHLYNLKNMKSTNGGVLILEWNFNYSDSSICLGLMIPDFSFSVQFQGKYLKNALINCLVIYVKFIYWRIYNLTVVSKSLKLSSIEEVLEKAGLLQIGKRVDSINNNSAVFFVKQSSWILFNPFLSEEGEGVAWSQLPPCWSFLNYEKYRKRYEIEIVSLFTFYLKSFLENFLFNHLIS